MSTSTGHGTQSSCPPWQLDLAAWPMSRQASVTISCLGIEADRSLAAAEGIDVRSKVQSGHALAAADRALVAKERTRFAGGVARGMARSAGGGGDRLNGLG